MKFIIGIITAMGFLIAINLVMIFVDIEAGNILDFTKDTATLNMEKIQTMDEPDSTSVNVTIANVSDVPGCETTSQCFLPTEVSIGVGHTVNWINDYTLHTVTTGNLTENNSVIGTEYPNGFDSKIIEPGSVYSHTFEYAGVYPYFCILHPWMTGAITVS